MAEGNRADAIKGDMGQPRQSDSARSNSPSSRVSWATTVFRTRRIFLLRLWLLRLITVTNQLERLSALVTELGVWRHDRATVRALARH